ncbi:MAG TPA: PRC-barrel domain-containing protein [Pyrinomonadaceae bacterium]|nr:PRC-barrel domain-containing protein [Pyrinomonadaceae bacterium]
MRTDAGGERVLPLHQLSVRREGAIVSSGDTDVGTGDAAFPPEGVFALREIVGASVITEEGELVGHVSDVHLVVRGAGVEYEVAPTLLQRILGGGLRLSAAAPLSFSRAGSRLIVPAAEVACRLPRPFDGVRAWMGTRSWELSQSARRLLNKYGVPLWFVGSATLLGVMFWL